MNIRKTFLAVVRLLVLPAVLWSVLAVQGREAHAQENRFLFIVNTSSSMRKLASAEVEDVVDLLASDMQGEFRRGDTIGLWTYDEYLHTDFPMQVWSKDEKSSVMTGMAAYLRARKYEKRGHLERVGPALAQAIKASERLTTILIFDGSTLVHGTPFDTEINMLQKKYARELKAERKPFVLVLVSREGTIDDFTINYPGAIAIPHTAYPEPIETNTPATAKVAPPPPAPPLKLREGPSIYISGPKPANHPAPPETVVVTTSPPPALIAPVATTPKPVTVPAPIPPAPAPVAPVKSVPVATPAPQPAPVAPATQPVAHETASAPAESSAPVAAAAQQPAKDDQWTQPKTASATVAEAGSGAPVGMFFMAILLLIVAVILVVFLLRRNRRAPQSSLITQTIDRPRPR